MKEMTELASRYVEKLEGVGRPVTSCHVVVDLPHRNQTKGRTYRVRVVCSVPGRKVVTAAAHHSVPQVALADAFNQARRTVLERPRRPRTARAGAKPRGLMVYNLRER
jgi:hypothetical protein